MAIRTVALMAKIAWVCALVLIGTVAIGLQMDRDARKDIALARSVPSVFQGSALEMLARTAYAADENDQGLAYSRALVAQRPIPAENLALLTRGLIASGKSDAALTTLLAAAQRGWRDRFTQYLMITSAQQVDDPEVAAQRLLALWRQSEQGAETRALTQNALADDATAAQFAQGMIRTDVWGTSFLAWASNHLSIHSVTRIADSLLKHHIEIDCEQLVSTIRTLAQTGQSHTAINIWSSLCSQGPVTSASAFDFRIPGTHSGPFDWRFPNQPGLNVELVEDAGVVSLQYENTEQLRVIMATRAAVLAAGTYTARLERKSSESIDSQPVFLQITCFSKIDLVKNLGKIDLAQGSASFQIPSNSCVGQGISLIAGRGKGHLNRLIIEP